MDSPSNLKTNFLIGQVSVSRTGLIFLFTSILGLALAIIGIGAITIIDRSQDRAKIESAKKAFRAGNVTEIVSNEKANPGTIAVYFDGLFAGALTDDGVFSPAESLPAAGTVTLLLLNPTDTPLPTTARFNAQTLTLKADTGEIPVCLPPVNGDTQIWIDKAGNTYYDQYLTDTARAC